MPGEPVRDGELSSGLIEYWRMISGHKRLLAAFAIIGALIGFAAGLPKKPVYRARTSLEVLALNDDFMHMKQASPISTTDYSYDTSESQTQVKILQSDALVKRVLLSMMPSSVTRSGENGEHVEKGPLWSSFASLSRADRSGQRERLLSDAAASRTVRVTPRTRILELTIDSTNAKLAADFANALASAYIEESQEARWKSSQKTSEWLANELNETRIKLERSEVALQEHARRSGLIFLETQANAETEKLQQMEQQRLVAAGDRAAKQSRYELAQKASPDTLPDVLQDGSLRQTAARINELKAQLANLQATYSLEYGKTKRIQAELQSLQQAFNTDRANILQRISNDYEEAARKERLLAIAYDGQVRQIVGQREKSIQYNILKREVDSYRQLYDEMLQQLKQSTVAAGIRTSNVRVLDPAEIPTVPIAPNFKVNTILGFIIALLAGSAYILITHHGNRTLQGPGELHFWTGLPELGAVPNVNPALPGRISGKVGAIVTGGGALTTTTTFSANCATLDSLGNVTWQKKSSAVAEAFRGILTSLLFAGDGIRLPKTIVITSSNRGDGKTIIAGNLGIALAEIGRKVLIIDGDLRYSRIHSLFGLDRRGLTDVIGLMEESGDVKQYIQQTRIPNLQVLCAGENNCSADLLYSSKLGEFVQKLAAVYDTILIDTPPMGELTDARVLARFTDGVIMIARTRQTTRDAAMTATSQLAADRIPVFGFIVNDWNAQKGSAARKKHLNNTVPAYGDKEKLSQPVVA
jgi:polysaccharide biosynthesis transport protein